MNLPIVKKLSFLSCSTKKEKAIALVCAAILAILLALVEEVISFAVFGLTSIGTWCNPFRMMFWFVIFFVAESFFVFRKELSNGGDSVFLIIALCSTLLMSVSFVTANPSWDEWIHFGNVLSWVAPFSSYPLSDAEAVFIDKHMSGYYSLRDLLDDWNEINQMDQSLSGDVVTSSIVSLYKSIAYIPSAIVYAILSAFGASASLRFVGARLIIAVIYSVVTYLGIRRLLSGKMIYAVIALFPTALFLASNYSYDYWVNAFMLYACALVIGELQRPNERLSKKRMVLIIVAFALACAPKPIYFPLIFLSFFLPVAKFNGKKGMWLFRLAVVGASFLILLSFALPYFFELDSGEFMGDLRGGEDVNSRLQIEYILEDPLRFVGIISKFMFTEYLTIPSFRTGVMIFNMLGIPFEPLFPIAALMFVFVIVTDKNKYDIGVNTMRRRLVMIVAFIILVAMMSLALYVSYTPVGLDTVNGMQGRYMLPLLFPLAYFLGTSKLSMRLDGRGNAIYNASILSVCFLVVMVNFWVMYVARVF